MGKWEVRVRRYNNKTISKTFIQKEDAHKWARETESINGLTCTSDTR